MSAATSDRATSSKARNWGALPVYAAVVLFSGCLTNTNSTGYLVPGADTSGHQFAGVVRKTQDNTDGASGDLTGEFHREGVFGFTSAALTQADIGQAVYALDDQTVVKSGHASLVNHVYVGRIVAVDSATRCWVDIRPGEVDPNLIDVVVEAAGTNASALSLSTAATALGGTGIYVKVVNSVRANITADAAVATVNRKVVTTNYTLASGVITTVTNESANTLLISLRGILQH